MAGFAGAGFPGLPSTLPPLFSENQNVRCTAQHGTLFGHCTALLSGCAKTGTSEKSDFPTIPFKGVVNP